MTASATAYIPSKGTEITQQVVRDIEDMVVIETINTKITSIIWSALSNAIHDNKESLITTLMLAKALDKISIKIVDFCFMDDNGVLLSFYFNNEIYTLDVYGDSEIVITTDSAAAEMKTFGQIRNILESDGELHRETNTSLSTYEPKTISWSVSS